MRARLAIALNVSVLLFGLATTSFAASTANTVILSSANPIVTGKPLTFVVAVAPAVTSFTYPSGSVTISVDGVTQTTVSLQKGSAQTTLSSLTVGSHAVVATYSGDGTYGSSVSPTMTQVVNASFDKPLQYGIDVTNYGVKGDGVTDNTAAIRAMIASFPADFLGRYGGQRFYFPAGTYLVSDSINLTKLAEVTLVGDVNPDGSPASTIKANSIATPYLLHYVFGGDVGTYYPLLIKESPDKSGTGPIHVRNLMIAAPTSHNGVGVILDLINQASFDNVVISGYIGIQSGGATFTSVIRNSKLIGPGTPGSTGLSGLPSMPKTSPSLVGWSMIARARCSAIGVKPRRSSSCRAIGRSPYIHIL